MGHYSIKPNKNIFTAFVGLIASGYGLADGSCDTDILDSIRKIKYDEDIIYYFKKARTISCKVNPYWPRAFLLSLSSLFLTEEPPYEYKDFNKLLSHIKSLQQINPSEKNEELIDWLKQLPTMINKLQNNIGIQEIWSKYLLAINRNIDNYNLISNQSFSLVKNVLDISEDDLPELIIIPNYLQAPQATDLVTMEEKIYIIEAKPNKESIIHELLHQILDTRLEECRSSIDENLVLLKPILYEMLDYQYAWDYDEDSWNRVFEENLMRAASTWVNFHDDITNARKEAKLNNDYGFIYVPVILECFFFNWKGINNFRDFIRDCLNACNN